MLIIPAIDLRGGRCVRLVQGDFEQETNYDDDPVAVARRWRELGARWIHVVDLDGARAGRPVQLDLVRQIAAIGCPIELGGGLRTRADLEAAFAAGVKRVVLGTAAIENPELPRRAVIEFGSDAVVLGVDARDGIVAVRGWEQASNVRASSVIGAAVEAGIVRVIYTDIERDGTLTSPNYSAIGEMARLGARVIASGGVANRGQLERLATIDGVEAAIVGKALYVGTLRITDRSDWIVEGPAQPPEPLEDDERAR